MELRRDGEWAERSYSYVSTVDLTPVDKYCTLHCIVYTGSSTLSTARYGTSSLRVLQFPSSNPDRMHDLLRAPWTLSWWSVSRTLVMYIAPRPQPEQNWRVELRNWFTSNHALLLPGLANSLDASKSNTPNSYSTGTLRFCSQWDTFPRTILCRCARKHTLPGCNLPASTRELCWCFYNVWFTNLTSFLCKISMDMILFLDFNIKVIN